MVDDFPSCVEAASLTRVVMFFFQKANLEQLFHFQLSLLLTQFLFLERTKAALKDFQVSLRTLYSILKLSIESKQLLKSFTADLPWLK